MQSPQIQPIQSKNFRSYPILIAIMTSLQIMSTIYGRHFFYCFGFNVAVGGALFAPALFYIFQIAAECYGWQYARQIFWCNFVVNGFTTAFYYIITYIPYNDFTKPALKISYQHLMDTMWLSSISWWLGIFLAEYITSSIMSKSKNWFNGRFLIFRLLILHCLSEILLFLGLSVSLPYNGYSTTQIYHLFISAFCARTIISIILLPIAKIVIWVIQERIEQVVLFDNSLNFWTIFKWNIHEQDNIRFNSKDWKQLTTQEIKNINIKQVAHEYYANHATINIKTK